MVCFVMYEMLDHPVPVKSGCQGIFMHYINMVVNE